MEQTQFTRKQLYDLVWSTPMTTIAKKYLISDVGLRKICISMSIPLPRAGHWEKIKAGKQIEVAQLSKNYSGKNEVVLQLRTEKDPPAAQKDPVHALTKELVAKEVVFKAPDILTSNNPLILKAQKMLTDKKAYMDKGLAWSGRGCLSINVSPQNVERALCFMQGLINVLEQRGHQLEVNNDETCAVVFGQSMTIALREKLKITRVPSSWGGYNNEYLPEGSLIFKLGKYGTKEWKDGNKKLEDQLPEIVARLEVEAQRINEAQIESRKREEEYREKEKQRLAFEQRKNTELVNFRKLIGDLDRWHLTQRLRQYLNDLEKHAAANNILTGELKEWLIWAHQKTDWYDPFISAKDEWLTEEDIRKIFTVEKSPYYSSFTNDAESSSYFPRPWYTK